MIVNNTRKKSGKMKILSMVLAMVLLLQTAIVVSAEERFPVNEPESSRKSHILIESSTGAVLSESNADKRTAPASLTKIMLLLIIAEEVNAKRLSLTDDVTVSANILGKSGAVIWLEPSETMRVCDMVKAVVIASANDAAAALAEHIAGSESEFVKLMNQKAYVLGMRDTNFVNATGYDHPQHYTTARDVAVMSRALMRAENYSLFSEFMLTRLCSVRTGTERETQLLNTNKLITRYDGIEGIKAGATVHAGYCLSASATKNNMRLIGVVMGFDDEDERVQAAETLLDYGFDNYELYSDFAAELAPFKDITVRKGMEHKLKVARQNNNAAIVIPKGRVGDIKYDIYLPEHVTAPIAQNQPVGTITAKLGGKVVHESYITATTSVYELTFLRVFTALAKNFFAVG